MEWVDRLGGLILGAFGAGVPLFIQLRRARSEERKAEAETDSEQKKADAALKRDEQSDTIGQWMALHKQDRADIAALKKEMADLRDEHTDCIARSARLETRVEYLTTRVAELESRQG